MKHGHQEWQIAAAGSVKSLQNCVHEPALPKAAFSRSNRATSFVNSCSALRSGNLGDTERLAGHTWAITRSLDALGLYTTEVYQQNRDYIMKRQAVNDMGPQLILGQIRKASMREPNSDSGRGY